MALHPKEILDEVSLGTHSKRPAGLSFKSSEAITATSFRNFGGHCNAVLLDGNEHPISCTHLPHKGPRSSQRGGTEKFH